jgi:hypothetical protein
MAATVTRLTYKIAIQLNLMTEICTVCSSRSRRPVQKRLDTPSYIIHLPLNDGPQKEERWRRGNLRINISSRSCLNSFYWFILPFQRIRLISGEWRVDTWTLRLVIGWLLCKGARNFHSSCSLLINVWS